MKFFVTAVLFAFAASASAMTDGDGDVELLSKKLAGDIELQKAELKNLKAMVSANKTNVELQSKYAAKQAELKQTTSNKKVVDKAVAAKKKYDAAEAAVKKAELKARELRMKFDGELRNVESIRQANNY